MAGTSTPSLSSSVTVTRTVGPVAVTPPPLAVWLNVAELFASSASCSAVTVTDCGVDQLSAVKVNAAGFTVTTAVALLAMATVTSPDGRRDRPTSYVRERPSTTVRLAGSTTTRAGSLGVLGLEGPEGAPPPPVTVEVTCTPLAGAAAPSPLWFRARNWKS